MTLLIENIGMVHAGGFGLGAFARALEAAVAPQATPNGRSGVLEVRMENAPSSACLSGARRADKLCRMALHAAAEAMDAPSGSPDPARVGLIMSTALGPHASTCRFLDGIIAYGDAGVSPTEFSHSVHNAAAHYVASALGIRGPALTLTRFFHGLHEGLDLARIWLLEGRCEAVLLGCAEEAGDVLEFVCQRKLRPASCGAIRPFDLENPGYALGEGAAFFLLRMGAPGAGPFCSVQGVPRGAEEVLSLSGLDLLVLDVDGLRPDETSYRGVFAAGATIGAYSPIYGSMLSGSAFSLAAAALMLRDQSLARPPVGDNPLGLPVLRSARQGPVRAVATACMDWRDEARGVLLMRTG